MKWISLYSNRNTKLVTFIKKGDFKRIKESRRGVLGPDAVGQASPQARGAFLGEVARNVIEVRVGLRLSKKGW